MNPSTPSVATDKSPIDSVFARVNYERSAVQDGTEFKLDTIRQILSRLGDPHLKLNVVHIAGTKGKGSTACFVSRIGSELGLKTGIYSSPHFERYTERFVVDNQEVSVEILNPALARVLAIVEELDLEIQNGLSSLRPATFFDISTAAAFLLFDQLKIELVALEVGLGGRLDSTNVCQPIASIVTNISLDHTKQLGTSTTQIGAEKAAIIKSAVPAICGRVNEPVYQVIEKQAAKSGADLTGMDRHFGIYPNSLHSHHGKIVFDFHDLQSGTTIRDLKINSIGEHQAHNACLAIEAIRRVVPNLVKQGFIDPGFDDCDSGLHDSGLHEVFEKAIRKGLSKTALKGRLEIASTNPLIITDMAHNEASIEAMIRSLDSLSITGEKLAVFSCSKDKDYRPMLRSMLGFFDQIILTEFEKNPRSQSAVFLLSEAGSIMESDVENLSTKLISIPAAHEALADAKKMVRQDGLIAICGSVFLVGELLPKVKNCKM